MKNRKPRLLKATKKDLAYLSYRRDALSLKYLAKTAARIDQLLARARASKPDLSSEEFVKHRSKRRASLQKKVRAYGPVESKRKRDLLRSKSGFVHDASANLYLAQAALAQATQKGLKQQQQSNPYRKVLGRSGSCEIVHGIVSVPGQFHMFEEIKTIDDESKISFVREEILSEVENRVSIDGHVSAADDFWSDDEEHGFSLLIHQYDIPAPTCDSVVRWHVNFGLHLANVDLLAEQSASAGVGVLLVASPDGSMPTITGFGHFGNDRWLPSINQMSEGDNLDLERPWDQTQSGSYEVRAGVKSAIFFGIRLDVSAAEGDVSATGFAWIGPPPGAIPGGNAGNSIGMPDLPPPFAPPIAGVQYLMWPKSMFPNCYITTAICNALGKPDDCYELDVLRRYRDTYVASLTEGGELISEYYAQAPRVLATILAMPDRNEQLRAIYERFLLPCIRHIEEGRPAAALEIYRKMVVFVAELAEVQHA